MRRVLRLASVIVALALIPAAASAQTGELQQQLGETSGERERAQQDLREARDREGSAREQLGQIEAELDNAEAALDALEVQLADARERVESAQQRATDARKRLGEVEESLGELEAEFAEKKGRLENRIRAAYKFGQVSFADTFVGSNDMADFLSSNTYVSHVLSGDRELIESVEDLLGGLADQRAEAQVLRVEAERETELAAVAAAEVEQAVEDQAELTALVQDRRAERAEALEALRTDRESIEGHLAGLEAESSRIQSQLAAIARQQAEERQRAEQERIRAEEEHRAAQEAHRAAEEARRQAEQERLASEACQAAQESGDEDVIAEACGTPEAEAAPPPPPPPPPPSAGGWTRPTAGHVTSPYGPRWGRNHNGVDLAGAVGAGVVAARSGTVVSVVSGCHPTNSWSCGGGFGNYITVAHDNGMATIYAHLSSIAVGTGQTVSAGQSIGAVGNSGNSYGSHLHFETREAGVPRNPCGYISC